MEMMTTDDRELELEYLPQAFKVKHVVQMCENVYVVQATFRKNSLWKSIRNMVIIRQTGSRDLTLIHAIRLNQEGEEFLQQLGDVSRVIRLACITTSTSAQHDLYYKYHYGAQLWGPPLPSTLTNSSEIDASLTFEYISAVDRILSEESILPIAHSKLFSFRSSSYPELAILIQSPKQAKNPMYSSSSGGILITAEALQNQKENYLLTMSSRTVLNLSGMMESIVVVPPKWLRSQQDHVCQRAVKKKKVNLRADFDRLLRLDFTQLISSKGAIVQQRAKEEAVVAVERAFPVW
jgi:hypothetical protein